MSKDEHDLGLGHDLETLQKVHSRRKALGFLFGAVAVVPFFGCTASTSGSDDTDEGSCGEIPDETAGPYPADGTNSNGLSVLDETGVLRTDLRPDLYGGDAAEGITVTLNLTLVNVNESCAGLAGYAIYLWHCDRDGKYSMYDLPDVAYLRGVGQTAEDGTLTFTTIFPACYSGRWPHMHFEVFETPAKATSGKSSLKTSQFAMPEAACDEVFATTGYEKSVSNLKQVTLSSDNVFGDGSSRQVLTMTGSVSEGYVANAVIGVAV